MCEDGSDVLAAKLDPLPPLRLSVNTHLAGLTTDDDVFIQTKWITHAMQSCKENSMQYVGASTLAWVFMPGPMDFASEQLVQARHNTT
jgi:hypothetical protein